MESFGVWGLGVSVLEVESSTVVFYGALPIHPFRHLL